MARLRLVAFFCAALFVAAAGGARNPLQVVSAAPPAGSLDVDADLLFVVTADRATFTSPSTLMLEGVAMSAASFRAGGRTTAYPLPEFASATPGSKFVAADGRWMGQPDALVTGTAANGSQAEALLVLAQPVYDLQARTLSFQVQQVPPQPQAVKYKGGAVSNSVAQHGAGAGPQLLESPAAGTVLEGVVIFIDQNQRALQKPAQADFGWGGSDSSLDYSQGYNTGTSSGNKNPPPAGSSPPPPGKNNG